jgi:hypothetical protein
MKSKNKGDDWKAISNDLTKGERKGNVAYGTITTISESNFKEGILYTGSDDGEIALTKNNGKKWSKISTNLPKNLWVSRVVASKHLKSRVYTTLNGYRYDDFKPYVYISEDYGVSWKNISNNLPDFSINVIKEDLNDENILYLGTDNGLFVSFNKGESWSNFENGMPKVAVHDIVIQPQTNDLIVATHGRSLYKTNVSVFEEYHSFKNKNLYVQNLQNIKHNGNWGNTWSKWLKTQEPSVTIQIYSKFSQKATLSILTKDDIKLKQIEISLEKGFNTINYDLSITKKGKDLLENLTEGLIITKKKNSKFYLIKGNYQLKITTQNSDIKTPLVIE